MEIARGDIVLVVSSGDYGKPRPALVVQSDLFNPTHSSIMVCLITSECMNAPLCRVNIAPSAANGLRVPSQIMVDKVIALKKSRLRERVGRAEEETMQVVNRLLALFLGLAGA